MSHLRYNTPLPDPLPGHVTIQNMSERQQFGSATKPPAKVPTSMIDPTEPTRNGYAQPVSARHFIAFMHDKPDPDPILAFAHLHPPPPPLRRILPTCVRRIVDRLAPLQQEGTAWVTAALVGYHFSQRSGIIALAHVQQAVIKQGGIDLHLPDHVIHIPALCRPNPFANIINGIIAAHYDPAQPFRPACRTCRHQIGQRCGAQPPAVNSTACCPDTAHLDWCIADRPTVS